MSGPRPSTPRTPARTRRPGCSTRGGTRCPRPRQPTSSLPSSRSSSSPPPRRREPRPGGVLAAAAAAGIPTHVVLASDGERSHPQGSTDPAALAEVRREEVAAAVAHLGASVELHRLALPDGGLADHVETMAAAVVDLVGDRLALVLAPWREDGHPTTTRPPTPPASSSARRRPRWPSCPCGCGTGRPRRAAVGPARARRPRPGRAPREGCRRGEPPQPGRAARPGARRRRAARTARARALRAGRRDDHPHDVAARAREDGS